MFLSENFFYHTVTNNTLKRFPINGEHFMAQKKEEERKSTKTQFTSFFRITNKCETSTMIFQYPALNETGQRD